MRSTVLAATISCLIGAAGFGGAFALAGGAHHCKPDKCPTTTVTTTTTPGSTVTVTTPAPPAVTVTLTTTTPAPPAQTVTVTTPAPPATTTTVVRGKPTCAHGDWDITAPRCKPKLIAACKGKYRREILRWCLRYEASLKPKAKHGNKPREQFHTGSGVTG